MVQSQTMYMDICYLRIVFFSVFKYKKICIYINIMLVINCCITKIFNISSLMLFSFININTQTFININIRTFIYINI